jgi:hypothetical protein
MPGRYALHDLLRAYAAELVTAAHVDGEGGQGVGEQPGGGGGQQRGEPFAGAGPGQAGSVAGRSVRRARVAEPPSTSRIGTSMVIAMCWTCER